MPLYETLHIIGRVYRKKQYCSCVCATSKEFVSTFHTYSIFAELQHIVLYHA